MLEDIRNSYIRAASLVTPDWRTTDVNTLCNLYVDNENDVTLRDGYFAGVLLKKWGYIGRHYINSKNSGFSIEDCYGMVVDAILYILKMHKWRDPSSKIYNDPAGPDKCLNRAIYSFRQLQYYLSNCQKRKANYNKVSLDQIMENVGDHTKVMETPEYSTLDPINNEYDNVVKYLLSHNQILEGVIVNSILYDACFSESVTTYKREEGNTVKRYHNNFKLSKLVSNISSYNDHYINHMCKAYGISKDKIEPVMNAIHSLDKVKLTKVVKSTLSKMGSDKELRKIICC